MRQTRRPRRIRPLLSQHTPASAADGQANEIEVSSTIEALVPIWQESLFAVDFFLLLSSPVFYGVGVKRGNGAPVMLLPGFTHGDAYLIVLYYWLSRMGYRPYFSGISFNADCPNLLVRDVVEPTLEHARRECGRKVHLIGHSFGGVIARSLATQRPADVASVITLGSPFQRNMVHKQILEDAEIVRRYIIRKHGNFVHENCYTPLCPCEFMKALRKQMPQHIKFTAVYTATDGVVDWRSCQTGNSKTDVQVKGTHAGLVFNPEVYKVVAARLAGATRARAKVGTKPVAQAAVSGA